MGKWHKATIHKEETLVSIYIEHCSSFLVKETYFKWNNVFTFTSFKLEKGRKREGERERVREKVKAL